MIQSLKNRKRIVTLSLVILALFFFAAPLQSSFAFVSSSVNQPIAGGVGDQTVSFRDLSDPSDTGDPQATVSIEFDKDSYHIGDTVVMTITFDSPANLDAAKIDTITADVVSTSDPLGIQVPLEESELNSGLFTGTFTITSAASSGNAIHVGSGDSLGVFYDPPLAFAGRLQMTIPESSLITGGGVRLSDEPITSNDEDAGFGAIIDSIKVELVGATVGGAGTATITMSYANAVILDPIAFPEDQICMLHQENPDEAWETLTGPAASLDPLDPTVAAHNPVARTVTNVLQPGGQFGDGSFHPEGRYVLAFSCDTGSGGGAGGLVRPGLVLNVLAGIGFLGGGGPDHSPPSLVASRPTSILSQLGFVAPDPFKPMSPTTDSSAPLKINNKGYFLTGYANTIEPEQVSTGENLGMTLSFLEASQVSHVAMYFVDQGKDEHSDTDPALIFDNGNIVKVDPQGIFGDDIQMSTSKEGTKSTFNFGMSFDKPTNKHIIIVAWDDKRNSGTTKVFNALQVVGNAVPDQVAHFMPIEDLGEFDLIKDDNGQYVLSQPAQTETITDLPQTTVYPEFVGRMERHDAASLYNVIYSEQQKAADIISSKMNVDNNLFSIKQDTKLIDHSKRAPQLSFCGKYLGCGLERENTDMMKTLMWEEHLKAEKILKAYLEQRNHRE